MIPLTIFNIFSLSNINLHFIFIKNINLNYIYQIIMSDDIIDLQKIYNSPITYNIIGYLIMRKFTIGLYIGVVNCKLAYNPVSQLFENIIYHTFWGCFEGYFWPVALPYAIINDFNKFNKYFRKK